MKKINLAVTGCMGRMGKQIIKSIKKNNNLKLFSKKENKIKNKKINNIKINKKNLKKFKNVNVNIDFTISKCNF